MEEYLIVESKEAQEAKNSGRRYLNEYFSAKKELTEAAIKAEVDLAINYNFDYQLGLISKYNNDPQKIYKIIAAYELANNAHKGVKRKSGVAYITHPLKVADNLLMVEADTDTICAALLHDVLEDTEITKEEIENKFGKEVAFLVEGVTKIERSYQEKTLWRFLFNSFRLYRNPFSYEMTEYDKSEPYSREKFFNSMVKDPRVLAIKLADRLHNMRTLEYKNVQSQNRIARETLNFYVPLARDLGIELWKIELEDLAFKYIDSKHKTYDLIHDATKKLFDHECSEMGTMRQKIVEELQTIPSLNNPQKSLFKIIYRIKSRYETYIKIKNGEDLQNIHNLLAITIIIDGTEDDCYLALGKIHQLFPIVNGTFKDYIGSPKANGYRSIHTTVLYKNNIPIQIQIKTKSMEEYNSLGIFSYWHTDHENAILKMLDTFNETEFSQTYKAFHQNYQGSAGLIAKTSNEILSEKIRVSVSNYGILTLPKGSTALDAAYSISDELGSHLTGIKFINSKRNWKNSRLFRKSPIISKSRIYPIGMCLEDQQQIELVLAENPQRKPEDGGKAYTLRAQIGIIKAVGGKS